MCDLFLKSKSNLDNPQSRFLPLKTHMKTGINQFETKNHCIVLQISKLLKTISKWTQKHYMKENWKVRWSIPHNSNDSQMWHITITPMVNVSLQQLAILGEDGNVTWNFSYICTWFVTSWIVVFAIIEVATILINSPRIYEGHTQCL
jgi:hypothetical protein